MQEVSRRSSQMQSSLDCVAPTKSSKKEADSTYRGSTGSWQQGEDERIATAAKKRKREETKAAGKRKEEQGEEATFNLQGGVRESRAVTKDSDEDAAARVLADNVAVVATGQAARVLADEFAAVVATDNGQSSGGTARKRGEVDSSLLSQTSGEIGEASRRATAAFAISQTETAVANNSKIVSARNNLTAQRGITTGKDFNGDLSNERCLVVKGCPFDGVNGTYHVSGKVFNECHVYAKQGAWKRQKKVSFVIYNAQTQNGNEWRLGVWQSSTLNDFRGDCKSNYRLYKSRDSGRTWIKMSLGLVPCPTVTTASALTDTVYTNEVAAVGAGQGQISKKVCIKCDISKEIRVCIKCDASKGGWGEYRYDEWRKDEPMCRVCEENAQKVCIKCDTSKGMGEYRCYDEWRKDEPMCSVCEENAQKRCIKCGGSKGKGEYSSNEWTKKASGSVCTLCQAGFSELPLDQQQLLQSVAEEYDSTRNCGQSDEFNLALSECVESGIDLGRVALYIRMNASGFASRLTFPYGGDVDYKRIMNLIHRATASKPLLTDVKPGSDRTPISRLVAETMLHKRLQEEELGDQDDPRVPYYKNPNVHSLLENSLQSAESIDVNSDGKHGDVRDRVKQQVSHKISDELLAGINASIAGIADPNHRMSAIQECLRAAFGERSFYFKGVVYFMQMQGPPEVKRLLEAINIFLLEQLFADKNGCSSDDLQLLVNKFSEMLSFVPSEYLRVIVVGIPYGLCVARELESTCHLLQCPSRIQGELFRSLELVSILTGLESIGCKIIADGTIGRVPGMRGGSPISVHAYVGGKCYIAQSAYVPDQNAILCELIRRLGTGSHEAREWVLNLLLHKIGMAAGDVNIMSRVQKFLWCSAAQGVEFTEITTPNARQLELRLHEYAMGLHKFGERFQLETIVDGQVDSSALEEMKTKLEGEGYELTQRTLEREWKPFTWSLRSIKRALRVGILKEEQIIDLIVSGDLKFC
ncbi:hypothetical protein THAOC_31163 [Thalassiosira oceanica]|uniref:Uncharacterized protein n=1 Tax=Thalassiosira oceanica TaxID=159749 RepID=K0RLU0_THAOC|nr:hypothetical protein THAOC_31163 [Thalassiosira oceanica]|eukprot:EJK49911.1 hypothetical protein THAOC_31163 [Thalassiosira oceanica]